MKQEALDIWHKLQAEVPGASADTFANWWRLRNFSNGEVAKLMNGVYKSGVLGAEGGSPGATRARRETLQLPLGKRSYALNSVLSLSDIAALRSAKCQNQTSGSQLYTANSRSIVTSA